MKAVLVIDMPDNLKDYLDKVKVDVIGTLNGQELFHRLNQPLKQMPQKKWVAEGFDRIMENNKEHLMSLGWNQCIEELEKG